ncbi:MAG: recombinase family protein [Ruminococcus sp.]|nr:recombinase family protein [Ruminococcus sp.]
MQKRIVFGYTRDSNKNIVLYKAQARYVRLIFQAYADGASLSQIAWALNANDVPSPKNKSTWSRRFGTMFRPVSKTVHIQGDITKTRKFSKRLCCNTLDKMERVGNHL